MLKKISDRIFYMEHSSETDRPVLGYIRGDKFSFMVDAGNSPEHIRLFYNALKEDSLPTPYFVGITHWHWDHCYGLCAVDAVSIACSRTNEYLQQMSRWEWTDHAMRQRIETGEDIEFCDMHIRKEYPERSRICIKTADLIFEEKLTIDLGGITCEAIKIGGSHSDDCVFFYIPQEKVLFVGDGVCGDIHQNGGDYYLDKLLQLIELLQNLDFEICLLGHAEPYSKERILEDLREEYAVFLTK